MLHGNHFWLSIYGVHIGATWRIRLSRPCAAAMRPYVKLRWPLVIIVVEGVTFPPAWGDRDPCDHFIRKQLEPRSSEYQEVYTNVMKTGASSVRQIIKVRAYVGRRFHFFSSGPSYIHLSPFTFNPFLFYVPSMPQFPTKRSFFHEEGLMKL